MPRPGRGSARRSTVPLEAGAPPGGERCPACGEPLFVWLETEGWGPREGQIVDRCENCGLVVPRGSLPGPGEAAEQLLAMGRAPNAASLQAWLGAENWAGLRPGERSIAPTPRAAELLLSRRGMKLGGVRQLAAPGIAAMWQTLLNLLTFHRDFATEAASGRLRPGGGRGLAAYLVDVMVTVLAAIPTALLAVVLEGAALLARRGGVIELRAERAG